jgi:type I restriction enzyme S subunit
MDTKKLRQKILDLAIRGKLVPQDPNDEPASVLLERIRTEKERLIKEGKIKRSKKTATDDEIEAPHGWVCCRFDEICSQFSTGPFGSMVHKSDYVSQNGIPIVNPMNIVDGKIVSNNLMMVSNEKAQELDRYRLTKGDVLIARRGDLSKCCVVTEESIDWLCGTGSFFLHAPFVDPRYIEIFYLSEYVQTILKRECVGATMDNLNQSVLGSIPFLLPPLSEQKRIITEVERWFAVINTLESNEGDLLKAIDQAKSKILDLAIHGKLVPQAPNDEPAIELLKRINPKFEPCDSEDCPFEVPNVWTFCHLQDVFNITMGSSPTGESLNRNGNGIEFHQGKLCFAEIYLEKSDVYTTQPVKLASPNSVLLCVRAPVGIVNIIEREVCIGRGLCSLTPLKAIDLMYSFYALQTCQTDFEQKATGSTFKAIGGDVIKNQIIPLPPYNEQLRIVAKIEELFAVLDSIKESLEA